MTTKSLRKIDLMHRRFGKCDGHTCGECSNLTEGNWGHRKCKVYGVTSSEASDWAKRWLACGMFNKPYTGGGPVIELVRRGIGNKAPEAPQEPLEGQITWEL